MNAKITNQINLAIHKKLISAQSTIVDYGHFARWKFGDTHGQVSPTKITQFDHIQKKFVTIG